jgi:hypothetical protein
MIQKAFYQRALLCAGIVAAYLMLSALLIGFKAEQLFLSGLFSICYLASASTRGFIKAFSIFIIYWIIFDYMKAFPNYEYNHVRIESLYQTEKNLFGIHENGVVLTPNEYLDLHHMPFLDILTGIFYLCWVPVPLAFAAYLYFKNRQQFYFFSLTFLLVNLLGFVVYYFYPAAPPWYIKEHGFDFIPNTPGNTGGLSRFDALTGTSIFQSIYAKSSNVFAAMPSLHSSYPVIVLYYGIKNKMGWVNALFALVMGGIWFAAVYNSHHYVLDVVAGITCAIAGLFVFNRWIARHRVFERFEDLRI